MGVEQQPSGRFHPPKRITHAEVMSVKADLHSVEFSEQIEIYTLKYAMRNILFKFRATFSLVNNE